MNIFQPEFKTHYQIDNFDKDRNQHKNRIIQRHIFEEHFVEPKKGIRLIDSEPDLTDAGKVDSRKVVIVLANEFERLNFMTKRPICDE